MYICSRAYKNSQQTLFCRKVKTTVQLKAPRKTRLADLTIEPVEKWRKRKDVEKHITAAVVFGLQVLINFDFLTRELDFVETSQPCISK